jgi:uncharacterized protein (TIGR02391 family)
MSKKKLPKKKKNVRKKKTLSMSDRQNVRELADQLGKLISLSGFRSSFSLHTVAKEFGLSKYIPKNKTNKKEVFSVFIENIICYKPRTLKKLVRVILPKAIEKRHKNGDPVLEQEILGLASRLKLLDIDMVKEIKEMNLPKERPKIVPPPIEIQKILDSFKLHPTLMPDCHKMFIDGHLNESVRKSLERFEKTVQDLSSLHDKIGPDLMAFAFDEQKPKIKLNNLSNKQEVNEQIGFKFITMGLMHWWRNNLSHGDEEQIPHQEAIGRLICISNLFSRLDERIA